jgi:putative transposase
VNRTRYLTRDEAKQDVFEYIECFYNRKRRHGRLGNISPDAFEKMGVGQSQPVH